MKPTIAALLGLCASVIAGDWPREMGPDGTGWVNEPINAAAVSREGGPAIAWSASAGVGGASPICVAGKVYALGGFTAGEEPSASSTPAKLAVHWDKPKNFTPLDIYLSAFDARDGRLLWRAPVSKAEPINRQSGIYASPTWYDGKVFVRTPRYVQAVDAGNGSELWRLDMMDAHQATTPCTEFVDTGKPGRGFMTGRGAPLVANGKLLVSFFTGETETSDKAEKQRYTSATVVALDPGTGKELWKHKASPSARTFSTTVRTETGCDSWEPALAAGNINSEPTVVMSTGHADIGIDSATGERRWIFHHAVELPNIKPFVNDRDSTSKRNPWPWWVGYGYVPPQVLIIDDIVISRTFCGHGSLGTSLYAFDIRDKKPALLWQTEELAARNVKYVVHDGRLYGIDLHTHLHTTKDHKIVEWPRPHRPEGMGQFQCRDIRTGRLLWSSDELLQSYNGPMHPHCEKGALEPGSCPALNDWLRGKSEEGGYSYAGDPAFMISGDWVILKGVRDSLSGLAFAKLTDHGLQRTGSKSFDWGHYYQGEPALADGRLFVKLDSEKNGLDVAGKGNLVCFDLGGSAGR